MWKQLTQKARKTVFLAQEEAGRLGYNHVGSEHLLLALIDQEDCIATTILERLGIDLGTIRITLMGQVSRGREALGEGMQLTEEAKEAIDLAFDEGKRMNDEWIGTEHLLIGLARGTSGLASKILAGLEVSAEGIRILLRDLHNGTLPFEKIDENSRSAKSLSPV